MIAIDTLRFDQNGLIPAIVQDDTTNQVLMLAYANRESLEITLKEHRTCFFSRSRQALWRKGETSGHIQHVVSIASDCDGDTLLIRVRQTGPACHTGAASCFEVTTPAPTGELTAPPPEIFSIDHLYTLLQQKQRSKDPDSYTSYLFEKGLDKILKKVGEESAEVLIAAKNNDHNELINELADLSYHALVLMVQQGITPQQVNAELSNRNIVHKKVKQETGQ